MLQSLNIHLPFGHVERTHLRDSLRMLLSNALSRSFADLRIYRYPFCLDSSLTSSLSLRHLVLSYMSPPFDLDSGLSIPTMVDLLACLENLPLEHVELHHAFRSVAEELIPSSSTSRAFDFPRLRFLVFDGRTVDCINLLNHILIPTSVTLSTRCDLRAHVDHLATAIAEKISGAALLRLLKLQEADDERKRFSVRIMGFNHAGSSSFLPNHDCFRMSVIPPPYQLHITLNGLRSWERPWRTLSTVCSRLPLSELRTLDVSGSCFIDCTQWLAICGCMKQLSQVRACQQAGSALLEALSKRREGAYNNPDSLFMPQLNHLSLHEVYCRQAPPDSEDYDVTDLLLESLKFRQGKGKRLEKLTLEYCININRRDVRQYREYVEKVVWDKGVHYEDPAESDSDLEDWRSIPDGWE